MSSIQVNNLSKHFGAQKAVDTISFSIGKGEIVGFLGPNGAGKSTTMKMITGYLQPDAGEITVSGINVLQQPQEVKRKTGYLPESNALYYDMYIKEYLAFIADVHHVEHKQKIVEDVIQLTGLTPEKTKKIGQLSKGYKQRVGLAAALLHNPEVLILDEPTSGLDPNQIIEIRQVIKDQGKDKLVLFSSHILQEVEAICDRIIIINKGRIVADDRLSNLQQTKTTNVVKVGFQDPLEAEWLTRLAAAGTVTKIDSRNWAIQTDEPEQLRKQLQKMAAENNLDIVSLHSETQSLEEVFRSLTGNMTKPSGDISNIK
ncbi:MAG: gliding motility-associated ABC transporter ATP-binding subunit GldA [Flavisolibacter sp.]|nr:gliding motility-associated ABC transporter ATP-binding subunit GldA [Flavisolibacter sp.]